VPANGTQRPRLRVPDVIYKSSDQIFERVRIGAGVPGRACANGQGCGVVFKLDAAGNYAVLYTFAGPDGTNPLGAIALDAAGNIYGTTIGGGASGLGVVFQVDQQGNETVLHNFAGAPDGRKPMGGVIIDASGNLYGTTYEGGKQEGGVIFKLTPPQ
jgi:uncharacterized repeat protein (TIGR03803 family)